MLPHILKPDWFWIRNSFDLMPLYDSQKPMT